MATAIASERAKPSSPTKAGILPSPLAFWCSAVGLPNSTSEILRSRLLAFATALMATERGLSYNQTEWLGDKLRDLISEEGAARSDSFDIQSG